MRKKLLWQMLKNNKFMPFKYLKKVNLNSEESQLKVINTQLS